MLSVSAVNLVCRRAGAEDEPLGEAGPVERAAGAASAADGESGEQESAEKSPATVFHPRNRSNTHCNITASRMMVAPAFSKYLYCMHGHCVSTWHDPMHQQPASVSDPRGWYGYALDSNRVKLIIS